MKTPFLSAVAALLICRSGATAQPGAKEEVLHAITNLSTCTNYTWKTKVTVPQAGRFRAGPVEGKTERSGFVYLTMGFDEDIVEAVSKGGDRWFATDSTGHWRKVDEQYNAEMPGRFVNASLQNFKLPTVEATELVPEDLKKEDDFYSCDLSEEKTRALLMLRRRNFGGDNTTIRDAKGWIKFWVKDGLLSKYQYHIQGRFTFNGGGLDVDRTTTVEIKEVNTTVVDVPEEVLSTLKPAGAKAATIKN